MFLKNVRSRVTISMLSALLCYQCTATEGFEIPKAESAPYTQAQFKTIHDTLITNPQKALQNNFELLEQFYAATENSKKSLAGYVQEYATKNPIFSLSECNDDACPLTRMNNPQYRAEFDKRIVKNLISKLDATNKTAINYVNLGAGNLFQDCAIMTQVLQQKPTAKVNIHLIDPMYEYYIKAVKSSKDYRYTAHNVERAVKSMVYSNDGIPSDYKDPMFKNAFTCYHRFQQFMNWFTVFYPQATINVFIYSSADDYIKDCCAQESLKGDVIAEVDPEPGSQKQQTDSIMITLLGSHTGSAKLVLLKKPDIDFYEVSIRCPFDFMHDVHEKIKNKLLDKPSSEIYNLLQTESQSMLDSFAKCFIKNNISFESIMETCKADKSYFQNEKCSEKEYEEEDDDDDSQGREDDATANDYINMIQDAEKDFLQEKETLNAHEFEIINTALQNALNTIKKYPTDREKLGESLDWLLGAWYSVAQERRNSETKSQEPIASEVN